MQLARAQCVFQIRHQSIGDAVCDDGEDRGNPASRRSASPSSYQGFVDLLAARPGRLAFLPNDYAVLTNDLDFAAILASTHHKKPSVVQIRAEDLDPSVIGTQIVAALQRVQKDLDAGALLTVETDRKRLRVLPFAIEP